MRIPNLTPLLSVALAWCLSACNRTESVAPTAAGKSPATLDAAPLDAAFVREARAIKSREGHPDEIEAAMRALSSRMGYPVLPEAASGPVLPAETASGALGKAAATNRWNQSRGMNVIYHFANTFRVTVPVNATLEVAANQVDGGTDPMVLGFYKTTGTANASAFRVQFVGFNDDWAASTLNSRFSWTNTSGASREVRLVSWSFPGSSGKTTLSYRVLGNRITFAQGSRTLWVSGSMQRTTIDPIGFEGCTGPSRSDIALERNPTHEPTYFGSSVVAFNGQTMRGAFIQDTDFAVRLEEVLPYDRLSFLLGYFEGDGYQPNPMDASLASIRALNAHYGSPFYTAYQSDLYRCP